jgi:hypothetical protein
MNFVRITYIGMFSSVLLCFAILLSAARNPEALIVGEWKELSWEYEMVDKTELSAEIKSSLSGDTGENLILHRAETWHFLPNGRLLLSTETEDMVLSWRLKGRGNILQLVYEDRSTEDYILSVLDGDTMCLNFDTDIQARGIARLTFEKVNH